MEDNLTYQKLIPAFRFSVTFVADGQDMTKAPKIAFSEVGGLSVELQTENIMEGGGDSIRLPKPAATKNLTLKRALSATPPEIIGWVTNAVENFNFETRTIIVSLDDYEGKMVKVWNFESAYPVKIAVSDFGSSKNELVIETLEFAYRKMRLG